MDISERSHKEWKGVHGNEQLGDTGSEASKREYMRAGAKQEMQTALPIPQCEGEESDRWQVEART